MLVRLLHSFTILMALSFAVSAEPLPDSPESILVELNGLKNRVAQNESCPEKTKTILHMLELYDSLIGRFSDNLRRFENPPGSETVPLSPALRDMIDQSQTDLLDWMLESADLRLDSLAWDPCWKIMISPERPPPEQIMALSQLLEQSAPYLRLLEQSIVQLQSVLEQDSHENWNERYGKTGFYERVKRLQNAWILTQVKYFFFRACVDSSAASVPSDKKTALRTVMQPLELLEQQLPKQESVLHRLWHSRLCRMAARDNPSHLQKARELLAALEDESLSNELYYPIQIESILCQRETISANPRFLLPQIDRLKQSLYDKLPANPSLFRFLIQLAILEGQIQSPRDYSNSVPPANSIHFLPLNPLRDLARRFPQYQDLLSEIMGVFLIHQLENQNAPPLDGWDSSDILDAARYGQMFPSLHSSSLLLYETFLLSVPEQHPQIPAALYQAGLLQYQIAKSLPENSDAADSRFLSSIRHWTRLARQFPHWKPYPGQPDISSETAIQNASAIACELYRKAPDMHRSLARETLELLVGQWEETSRRPSGPFCQSGFARQSRYHYALILLADKQYDTACRWFHAVPETDPNKSFARYYAICAEKFGMDLNPIPTTQKNSLIDTWIHQLLDIIHNENSSSPPGTNQSLSANIVLLAVSLYLEMSPPQPETALALLEQQQTALKHLTSSTQSHLLYFHANALYQCNRFHDAISLLFNHFENQNPLSDMELPLLRLSLQILLASYPELLSLQGKSDYNTLQSKLTPALSFAQTVFRHPQIHSDNSLSLSAHQSLLQLLSLHSIFLAQTAPSSSSDLEDTLQKASPILSVCQNHPQASDTLWLIRCQAFFAFARQDYAASQALWARIRQSTDPAQDQQSAFDWWQARYFGLLCLDRLGRSREAAHSLRVLSKTYSIDQCPWKIPLRQLEQTLAQSK